MSCTNQPQQGEVFSTLLESWATSVERLLHASELQSRIAHHPLILIKPNLVNTSAPPVTTPVELVEEIIITIKTFHPDSTLCIGEGTGSVEYDTHHCFSKLGYIEMAQRQNVELIDLNHATLTHKKNAEFKRWPEMYLPEILDNAFIISVPVLKAHSLAGVTLTMKNMMGCVPPTHYQQGGCWGKSAFHTHIHAAVFELNRYRTPDFTILDATIGMSESHLWGAHCNPPVGRLCASYDSVAIDRYGCDLLQKDWQRIGYIQMANAIVGCAEPLKIHEV